MAGGWSVVQHRCDYSYSVLCIAAVIGFPMFRAPVLVLDNTQGVKDEAEDMAIDQLQVTVASLTHLIAKQVVCAWDFHPLIYLQCSDLLLQALACLSNSYGTAGLSCCRQSEC